MNTAKIGKVFIVLMVSLVAFGCGSFANVLNAGNDVTNGLIPSTFAFSSNEQILQIEDPSFEPVHIMRHFYNNTTNLTNSTNLNSTISSTTNQTSKPVNGTKKNQN
ncbi:MAG: hypothetical protein ACPK7O_04030 [Methanobacterium sp.]